MIISMKKWFVVGLLVLLYLITRMVNLTILPVFADEAIYIRWGQLIEEDWQRYAFFSIQDGKPPLFMWVLAATLFWYRNDPLLVARTVSVVFGLVSMFLVGILARIIGLKKVGQVIAMSLYVLLPYTCFHDRMALIDTMLLTYLLVGWIGFVLILKNQPKSSLLFGVGIGLSLWAKTSSLMMLPAWGVIFGLRFGSLSRELMKKLVMGLIVGIAIFAGLRFEPTFPALFTRSRDFTFSVGEVISGQTSQIWPNALRVVGWLLTYALVPLVISLYPGKGGGQKYLVGPFELIMGMLVFSLPFMIFGRVIAARYLFPLVIFLILLVTQKVEFWFEQKRLIGLQAVLIILAATHFLWFWIPAVTNPGKMPLTKDDEVQYLTEWSAGYGIPEVRDFIKREVVKQRLVVATEGTFGTLPDGLSMYFFRTPWLADLEIYGVGQPVSGLSNELLAKARVNATYLVVNSHRLKISLPNQHLLLAAEYQRPRQGPSLQLYRVIP